MVIFLRNKDFKSGTYRIQCPGVYVLKENIVFSPNRHNNFFPQESDERYSGPAFILGFFAAISVECDDVCIDLNGHCLSYSKIYALQQRYGSLIELSSIPFPPGMGPASFGPKMTCAKRIVIRNGFLGLVSHHSIHGNNNHDVKIENVKCRNFEVAAISLNGCTKLQINNVVIGPNRQDIPVLGTYSHARFLLYLSKSYLNKYILDLTDKQYADICQCIDKLQCCIDTVFDEICATGKTQNSLFANPTGLLDSNCYGICVYSKGIAVHDLVDESYAQEKSNMITIKNVKIRGLKSHPIEVVSISEPNGNYVQFDIAGGAFKIFSCMDPHGKYQANPLSDLQLALACPGLPFGNMTICKNIVDWSRNPCKSINDVLNTPYSSYRYRCGGDVMFHLTKGVIGLRIDGTQNFLIKNVQIHDISNTSWMGNDRDNGKYITSHSYQSRPQYHGCDTLALSLSCVDKGKVQNVSISNICSFNGEACGLYINSKCNEIKFRCIDVSNIKSGYRKHKGQWYGKNFEGKIKRYSNKPPNPKPKSIGVHMTEPMNVWNVKKITIDNLSGPITKMYLKNF